MGAKLWLVMLQAEHEGARAQAAAAGKAAEAAEQRCEELQWRLQQQDAALAQRTKLAEEARAATEGLSKVHLISSALSSTPHGARRQYVMMLRWTICPTLPGLLSVTSLQAEAEADARVVGFRHTTAGRP